MSTEIPQLPDVSQPEPQKSWGSPLSWVGMSSVELPLKWQGIRLPARVDVGVNLNSTQARGIHMSRLYGILMEGLSDREFSFPALAELATKALASQGDLSSEIELRVMAQIPLERASLKTALTGWRTYPVEWSTRLGANHHSQTLTVEVLYSSTCPASAALAWQIQSQSENRTGFAATPHAQRSRARVEIENSQLQWTPEDLIGWVEEALGTPVQTFVKREDEQEFARKNAQNLLFCEDAARRIDQVLREQTGIRSHRGEVQHFESLHPHNAVARFEKAP